MTAAKRVNHVRSVGPRKHGVPLCSKCQLEERYQIPVSAWPSQKPSKRKPANPVESKQRLIEVKF